MNSSACAKMCFIPCRQFSKSSSLHGKRNFRKFILPKRGTEMFKKQQETNPNPEFQYYKNQVKEVGYKEGSRFISQPERIPQLIVPDLTDFELKPYVSYRVSEVVQSELTPKDLFNWVYSKKIVEDFKSGKLDENGNSFNPSKEELLTSEEAKIRARKTGSDIFTEMSLKEEEERYFISSN